MFEDRTDAGDQLAEKLVNSGIEADLVLAIPRGALPVARPVADRLGVPLDITVAKKLGMPGNPEFALGAAAADGSIWLNESVVEQYDVDEDYIERERDRAAETAREKVRKYRGTRPEPDVRDKTVIVIDDGVATGATARACLRQLRSAGAGRIVLAVPVGPATSLAELEQEADAVVALARPRDFGAVGAHYRDFDQVTDEEASAYLGWHSSGS